MTLTRDVKPGCWEVFLGGVKVGSAATRKAALNQVERPYRPGLVQLINRKTGEAWERRRGSWFRTLEPAGKRHEALAEAGS